DPCRADEVTMIQRDRGTGRLGDGATGRPGRIFAPSPRRLVALSLFICLLAAPTRHAQQGNPSKEEGEAKKPPISSHVILIAIDGLRSDFVTGAESQRLNIPNIQALRARGSQAVGIESVFPTQTVPAHASMITGSPPSDHGVTSDY